MSPAYIEVGVIEPLEETHMVEALGLWGRRGEVQFLA